MGRYLSPDPQAAPVAWQMAALAASVGALVLLRWLYVARLLRCFLTRRWEITDVWESPKARAWFLIAFPLDSAIQSGLYCFIARTHLDLILLICIEEYHDGVELAELVCG